MNNQLVLKNIYFGKVDAKNELLENTPEQRENFVKTFLLPEHFNIEAFQQGRKYFIYGLKGTGKTAFLRYLGIEFEDRRNSCVSFVLFKNEFGEDDKQDFSKAANVFLTQSQFENFEAEQDFEQVWKWFFFRHIVEYCDKHDVQLFEHEDNWYKFKKHVMALKIDQTKTGLSKYIPKIKKGEVELDISAGKVGLDFEFGDHPKVKFSQIVKIVEKYFYDLVPVGKKLYILIDELELTYQTTRAYGRDARLIRDLIIVTNKLNTICRAKHYPIFFISSVRSEVLTAIAATGKEINKIIEDFGMLISWHQAGGDIRSHPIIEIIIKRLHRAEERHGKKLNSAEIWAKYFPELIQGKNPENYILNNTWYRPRDVVRLLGLAQDIFPNETSIGHKVFDGIRKQYSSKSWGESLEELRATYKQTELDALYRVLCGWKKNFIYEDILSRINAMSKEDQDIEAIRKRGIPKLLHELYHTGIIGNRYDENGKTRFRFIFRGDEHLLIEKGMKIHNALGPHLSIW